MKWFVLKSWLLLLYFECIMLLTDFRRLHSVVEGKAIGTTTAGDQALASQLCRAMDIACVFYFKRVLCLQRSAATTLLLRDFGFNAEMVIGVQLVPFRSHAWVEIGAEPVNDRPYMPEIYQVLERC